MFFSSSYQLGVILTAHSVRYVLARKQRKGWFLVAYGEDKSLPVVQEDTVSTHQVAALKRLKKRLPKRTTINSLLEIKFIEQQILAAPHSKMAVSLQAPYLIKQGLAQLNRQQSTSAYDYRFISEGSVLFTAVDSHYLSALIHLFSQAKLKLSAVDIHFSQTKLGTFSSSPFHQFINPPILSLQEVNHFSVAAALAIRSDDEDIDRDKVNFLPWRQCKQRRIYRAWCVLLLFYLLLFFMLFYCFHVPGFRQIAIVKQQQKMQLKEREQTYKIALSQRNQGMKQKRQLQHQLHQQKNRIAFLSSLTYWVPKDIELKEVQQSLSHYQIKGVTVSTSALQGFVAHLKTLGQDNVAIERFSENEGEMAFSLIGHFDD